MRVSAYDDPEIEALSIEAQWLYFKVLLPHPALSSCGVMDWRPKKLIRKASNASITKILAAAAELERARWLMFDLETEEVLLRPHVREDELLKNPKMAGAVVKAYQSVASRELQAALVTEMKHDREEHPDYSSWSHKDTVADLTRILSRPDLSAVGYTNAFADQIDYGNTDVKPVEITNPDPVRNGYPRPVPNTDPETVADTDPDQGADNPSDSVGIPSTSTYTSNQHHSGGHLTGERHLRASTDRDDSPPRSCPQHPDGTTEPCTACGIYRRARDAHDEDVKRRQAEQRAAEREAEADAKRRAIEACPLGCAATDGYLGTTVCDHDPGTVERARRGSAAVRAVLAEKAARRAQSDTPEHPHADRPDPEPVPDSEEHARA
jgi:hypothetical protein